MSVWSFSSSIFTMAPSVQVDGDKLIANSPILIHLLTLLSYARTVTVHRDLRFVHIRRRVLWLGTKDRRISFDQISHVTTNFSDYGTSWGFSGEGWGRHDTVETYRVGLQLVGDLGETVHLFSFHGDGERKTGWSGALLGDSLIDTVGTQAQQSRRYAKQLSRFIDRPIGKPDVHAAAAADREGRKDGGDTGPIEFVDDAGNSPAR